jgi:hypothetical protein
LCHVAAHAYAVVQAVTEIGDRAFLSGTDCLAPPPNSEAKVTAIAMDRGNVAGGETVSSSLPEA